MRGFRPLRYLDGLRLPTARGGYSLPSIDPYALESIEVLKGPASVLYGQSSPGGLLNMVGKLPQAQTSREVVLQAGSHDRMQGAFDLTGPVDEDGKLLYRVVGLARDTNHRDRLSRRSAAMLVAPSLTWRPSTDTSLTLMAQYQKIRSDGGGAPPALPAAGTLLPNPNGSIPTNRFDRASPPTDKFESEQMMFGYKFAHRANETWQFRRERATAISIPIRSACRGYP